MAARELMKNNRKKKKKKQAEWNYEIKVRLFYLMLTVLPENVAEKSINPSIKSF